MADFVEVLVASFAVLSLKLTTTLNLQQKQDTVRMNDGCLANEVKLRQELIKDSK